MFKWQEAFFEALVSFLTGGLPVLIAYWIGGMPFLETSMKALLPNEFPLWCTVALGAAATLFLFVLKMFSLPVAPLPRKICLEVHSDLHAIYRLGAGALLTFSALWVWVSGTILHGGLIALVLFGAVSLLICMFYGRLTQWLEQRASPDAA